MYQSTDHQITGPYAFISYAHLDSNRVLPSVFELMDKGYNVWYDAGIEAGTEWPEYIAERLFESHAMLLFMSNYYLCSQNCMREVRFAAQLKKKIILVFLEDLIIPDNIKKLISNAPVLYYKDSSMRDRFMAKLCALDVMSPCKNETVELIKDSDTSIEDDLFYAKEYQESGKHTLAIQRLKHAAEKESAEAQYQLSDYYRGGAAEDLAEAARLCRLAATAGHAIAQNKTGCDYLNGHGVAKDTREAVKWFRKSAEAGYFEGQYMLACCYKDGTGVAKDLKEARYWYSKAAEQGDSYAENALMVLDDLEAGFVPKDPSTIYLQTLLKREESAASPVFVDTNDMDSTDFTPDDIAAFLGSLSDEELSGLLSAMLDDDL